MILILIKHFSDQGLSGSIEILEICGLYTKGTSNINTCTGTVVLLLLFHFLIIINLCAVSSSQGKVCSPTGRYKVRDEKLTNKYQ